MRIGPLITYLAVASWSVASYMLPVVAIMVWMRRWRDKAEITQEDEWVE